MNRYQYFLLALSLLLVIPVSITAQNVSEKAPDVLMARFKNEEDKIAPPPTTVNKDNSGSIAAPNSDLLIRLLINKGIISNEEASAISAGNRIANSKDQTFTLGKILLDKGIISPAEWSAISGQLVIIEGKSELATPAAKTAVISPELQVIKKAVPTIISAVAPINVFANPVIKRDGMIPDLKLATGVKLKLYGSFKTSIVQDSSSPLGNDFPLPGFIGDTGPDLSPEFHIKARALRLGANFEWLDPAPNISISGRLEFDFEGSFPRANNRNISAIRSSQPSLRLAWARVDWRWNDKDNFFAIFGQDWTPFASSTLPNLLETTGYGVGYGVISQRAPQVRIGSNFKTNHARSLSFQPEFAIVLPAFGNIPANLSDQEGFGERQGTDANKPEVQGRFVTQFQLDKAPGVAAAQFIISFVEAERKVIVRAQDVPGPFKAAFPQGASLISKRYGYTLEAQLPTRFVTILAKYYRGADLRFYFAGQLFSNFNDTAGLNNLTAAPSIDGASTVFFGLRDGLPEVAAQRPVRTTGGFINIGLPLSRLFNADPQGRQAGWTAYLHYSCDQAVARDVRRFGNRSKSDLFAISLFYKMNQFVTFAYEQSLYRTRAVNSSPFSAGGLPILRGLPARETQNLRSEFAAIFTF